jgi:hypothetical protein
MVIISGYCLVWIAEAAFLVLLRQTNRKIFLLPSIETYDA